MYFNQTTHINYNIIKKEKKKQESSLNKYNNLKEERRKRKAIRIKSSFIIFYQFAKIC